MFEPLYYDVRLLFLICKIYLFHILQPDPKWWSIDDDDDDVESGRFISSTLINSPWIRFSNSSWGLRP